MEKGLLDKEKYYKSQIDALNKQIKNGSESLPLAQARIGVLEKELDEANKAKGGALLGAEEYKTKFESSQKGTLIPTPQIIFSLIIQYIGNSQATFFIGNSLKPKGGDKHG